MKLMTKRLLYALAWVAFAGWLAFSNQIIAFCQENTAKKSDLSTFEADSKNTFAAIDVFNSATGLSEKAYLSGWAYCVTKHPNDERETWLIFVSDEQTYAVQSEVTERFDLVDLAEQTFGEEHSIFLGMRAEFSTAAMKDGIYTLYVYCRENEFDQGLVKTAEKYVKQGKLFEKYQFQSQQTEYLTAQEDLYRCSADNATIEGLQIQIDGWAFLEGTDCAEQEVFVQLTGESGTKTFTTESRERADVAEAYESDSYLESGYVARIPAAELEAGSYTLELYVKNGDRIAGTEKGTLQISEDGTAAYQAAGAAAPVTEFRSEKVEALNSQDTLETRMVENVVSSESVVEISGWALLEGMDCAEQEVFVQLTGENGTKTFTTESRERADVAEAYGSDGYLKSGYLARIPAAEESQNGFALKP